ncbi:MAG TPA: hypothetical protein VIE36_23925 [Methylomirabilota bacterium]|jgi:hypothetical protein
MVVRRLLALGLAALVLPVAALGSEWGNIIPATTTMDAVRAQHGGPTRTENQKIDNYDTTSWIYEGAQAPVGLLRMVVDFGILQAAGYRRDIVRSFRIEPKAGVFHRRIVLAGWGAPERVGKQAEGEVFYYADGLVVMFDKEGLQARTLLFTPPQPIEPGKPSR